MSDKEEITLEGQAVTEILKEVKRSKELARDFGALAWQKQKQPLPNKRFLNNTLVSTLRHSYREERKHRDGSYKKYKQHMQNRHFYKYKKPLVEEEMESEQLAENIDYGEFDAAKYAETCTELYIRDSHRKHSRMRQNFVEKQNDGSSSEDSFTVEDDEDKAGSSESYHTNDSKRKKHWSESGSTDNDQAFTSDSNSVKYKRGARHSMHHVRQGGSRHRGEWNDFPNKHQNERQPRLKHDLAMFESETESEDENEDEESGESGESESESDTKTETTSQSQSKSRNKKRIPNDGKTLLEKLSQRSMYADIEEIKKSQNYVSNSDEEDFERNKTCGYEMKRSQRQNKDFPEKKPRIIPRKHSEEKRSHRSKFIEQRPVEHSDSEPQERVFHDQYKNTKPPHQRGYDNHYYKRQRPYKPNMERRGYPAYRSRYPRQNLYPPMPLNPFYASFLMEQMKEFLMNHSDFRKRSRSRSRRSHKKRKYHRHRHHSRSSSSESRSKSRSRSRSKRRSRHSRSNSHSRSGSSRENSRSQSRSWSRRRSRKRSKSWSRSRSSSKSRKQSRHESGSRSGNTYRTKSRNKSRSRSKSRSSSRSKSRSKSKSRRRSRRNSYSRNRSRSKSQSRNRSRSKTKSRNRSRSKSQSRRRSRSKSKSRSRRNSNSRNRSKTKSNSRNRSGDNSKSRNRSRTKSYSRSRSRSKSRSRSRSKSRRRSRSESRKRSRSESRRRSKSESRKRSRSESRRRSKSESRSRLRHPKSWSRSNSNQSKSHHEEDDASHENENNSTLGQSPSNSEHSRSPSIQNTQTDSQNKSDDHQIQRSPVNSIESELKPSSEKLLNNRKSSKKAKGKHNSSHKSTKQQSKDSSIKSKEISLELQESSVTSEDQIPGHLDGQEIDETNNKFANDDKFEEHGVIEKKEKNECLLKFKKRKSKKLNENKIDTSEENCINENVKCEEGITKSDTVSSALEPVSPDTNITDQET